MANREMEAWYDMDCQKCETKIKKGAPFYWFEDLKICASCWFKLIEFWEGM